MNDARMREARAKIDTLVAFHIAEDSNRDRGAVAVHA
jgi:hypothetical protein